MTTVKLVLDVDVVGELVDVRDRTREELAELFAGALDRFDDAIGELSMLKAERQFRRDLIPESGRHFVVDAFVAEDHETLLLAGDEEQHAGAEIGPGHAETFKGALGDVADVAMRARLNVHANLAGRSPLRGPDRVHDLLPVERRKKLFLMHH